MSRVSEPASGAAHAQSPPDGPASSKRASIATMLARCDDDRAVLMRIVLLALALRAGLWIVGAASQAAHRQRIAPLGMWSRWDAPHYLSIAEDGYRTTGEAALFIVFFPFFPLVVRIVSFVVRDLVASGLLVSLAAQVGAGWFLYRLAAIDEEPLVARRSVAVLFCFPTAYFLAAPYTESLFLCATLGAVYAARTDRWARSALAAAAATATRLAGVALLPALAFETLRRRDTGRLRWMRLGWVGLAAAGILLYLAVNLLAFGDPLHFLGTQSSHWFQRAVPPWVPLEAAVRRLANEDLPDTFVIIFVGRLAAFALAVAVLVAGRKRLRGADQVYAWAGLALVTSASWLISLPRYLLGLYPIFIVLGAASRRTWVFASLVAAGLAAQAWFFWRYAAGAWTF